MRGKVAKGIRAAVNERFKEVMDGIADTMYWQDPRTGAIRRTTTCLRSLYQQSKTNYNKAKRG